jgi:hypothetical protein
MPLSRIPTRSRTLAAKPRPCRCEIRWKARPVSSLPWQARAARRIWRTRDLAWSSSPFEQPGNHDWWRSIRSARGSAAKALPLPLDSSLAAPDRKVRPISRPDGRGSTTDRGFTTTIGPSLQFCLQPIDSDRTVSRRAADRLGASRNDPSPTPTVRCSIRADVPAERREPANENAGPRRARPVGLITRPARCRRHKDGKQHVLRSIPAQRAR